MTTEFTEAAFLPSLVLAEGSLSKLLRILPEGFVFSGQLVPQLGEVN